MADEKMTNESGCSHDCGSCASAGSCSGADPASFLEPQNSFSDIKHVIGIVSGKGGVRKSLVTGLLAVELSKKGYKVGILDADITGPSIQKMFGIAGHAKGSAGGILPEVTANGIEIMSINLLLEDPESPVIWRGPVLAGVVKQFWNEVVWGELDYLLVDMPPGTGDVPLTVFQSLPLDGIVIVTSPQSLVSMIVKKAYHMAETMNIPILGVIENYSYFECPDCKKRLNIFGESNIDKVAEELKLEVLGKLPIDPSMAKLADEGKFEYTENKYIGNAVNKIESLNAPKE